MKKRDAIIEAIETLGSTTGVDELHAHAEELAGKSITPQYVVNVRLQWREENNKSHEDCRTYTTQPRRNMLRDDTWDAKATKELMKVVPNPKAAKKALRNFHSIDQLRNSLELLARTKELGLKAA